MRTRWKVVAVAVPFVLLGVLTTGVGPEPVPRPSVPVSATAPRSPATAPEDAEAPESDPEPEEPEWRVLGEYTTHFKTGAKDGRIHNITKLSLALNFSVRPGETWSFNESLGPRTKERGYLPAPTIVLGEMTESYGGGTCQVSSTTFVAALKAGLEVVERRAHSRPSSYMPKGMDATVSYPKECLVSKPDLRICPDLKIKNPYDFPVTIKGFDGRSPDTPKGHESIKVLISGWGEPPQVTTKWRSWKTTEPEKRFRKVLRSGMSSFQKQKPALGLEGVLVVKTNGEETRFISRYKPVDEIWYVPIDWEEEASEEEAPEEEYPEEP